MLLKEVVDAPGIIQGQAGLSSEQPDQLEMPLLVDVGDL